MSNRLVNTFKQIPFKRGKWIAPRKSKNIHNFYFRAKNEFELSELPKEAVLHISAESHYLLFVNGVEVGRGPARGTHKDNYYDSYEIASLFKIGHNIIAVLVQCMNYDAFMIVPVQPGVIVELNGMIASNATWDVCIAADWRRDAQAWYCEWRDLRQEPVGWTTGEDSAVWETAWQIPKSSRIYKKELLPRAIPALTEKTFYPVDIPVMATVPPLTDFDDIELYKIMIDEKYTTYHQKNAALLAGQDGCFRIDPAEDGSGRTVIFDFGTEICGRFELDITAPEGCVVDVCYNEAVEKDRLAVSHLLKTYPFVDRYILREARQRIGNTLFERGFKMVQIVLRNFEAPVVIHQVKAIDVRYPFVRRASFHCSDFVLNRIWDACRETLECCATDVSTDCPWRGRAFWLHDLIVENKVSLQAFGVSEMHRRRFRLVFSDVREGNIMPGACPCPEGSDPFLLVSTNLYIIFMLKDYLMYSNDPALIKELMPNMVAILETFSKWEDPNGFILPPEKYWDFFDWPFELKNVRSNGKAVSLLSYLYIIAMKEVVELAEMTGEKIDCAKYESKIKMISSHLEECFSADDENCLADWMDERGHWTHSSQLAYAFALLSGECSAQNRFYFENALSDKKLLMSEMYSHYFVFHAMRLCGKEAEALEQIRKCWGDIMKAGSSAIWDGNMCQHFKGAFPRDGSLCYGLSTVPIDFFQTVLLGIEPLSPGFKTFKVAPVCLDIEFAEGRIPTPYGNIFIRWKRKKDDVKIKLRVPYGTIAKRIDGVAYAAGEHCFNLSIKNKKEVP